MDLEQVPDYEFDSGIAVPRFDPDSTYALILFHDLLGLGPDWEVMTHSVQINRPYERWAATVWAGAGVRAWISWPVPLVESFWEIDIFVSYWNRVVEACEQVASLNSLDRTLELLVYGWIDAAWAVWSAEEPHSLRDPRDSTQIVHPLPWTDLGKKVAELIPLAKEGRINSIKEWLWRLAYFLSPAVSGVRQDVAKAFVAQAELRSEWERSADLIKGYHQQIVDFFYDKKMGTLARNLEDACKKHLDVLFPKGNPPSPPSSRRTSRKAAYEDKSKANKPSFTLQAGRPRLSHMGDHR